jgi:uncharacterized protein YndB with AHSA1/START domain
MGDLRVEHQGEVDGERTEHFALVATEAGLRRWLDGAEFEPRPGGRVRFVLRDAVAVGRVLAIDPPQHVSVSWDWEDEPLGYATVVAFDLIDHGRRTHLTVRHVGFRGGAQAELHDALWRTWFGRLLAAARLPASRSPTAVAGPGAPVG